MDFYNFQVHEKNHIQFAQLYTCSIIGLKFNKMEKHKLQIKTFKPSAAIAL